MAISGQARGKIRFFDETPTEVRTESERDCDRVLYCSAFQRLAGITQVTSPEPGHVIHNRLTHSLKVAQVGRRLVERLQRQDAAGGNPLAHVQDLQADAVAAAALAHDLGHPPFGHVAELELKKLAASWGSYEGNAQSFRIVTRLAGGRGDNTAGLNLSRRTLNALLKYPWVWDPESESRGDKWGAYPCDQEVFDWARAGLAEQNKKTMEAAIMDWADDVTYAVHDVEDFYRAGLVPLDRLNSDKAERDRFIDSFFEDGIERRRLKKKFVREGLTPDELLRATEFLFDDLFDTMKPYDGGRRRRVLLRIAMSVLIDRFICAVEAPTPGSVDISQEQRSEVAVLKEMTWFYLIETPSLATIQRGQRTVIRELHEIYFDALENNWSLFPRSYREELRENSDNMGRVVTDLVAGLTESAAYELHGRLTGRTRGSVLGASTRPM